MNGLFEVIGDLSLIIGEASPLSNVVLQIRHIDGSFEILGAKADDGKTDNERIQFLVGHGFDPDSGGIFVKEDSEVFPHFKIAAVRLLIASANKPADPP